MGSGSELAKATQSGRVAPARSGRPPPSREPPLANSTRVAMAESQPEEAPAPRTVEEAVALLRPDLEARARAAQAALPDVEQRRAVLARQVEQQQAAVAALDRQGRRFEDDMEPRLALALSRSELGQLDTDRAALRAQVEGARADLATLGALKRTAGPGDLVGVLRPALERDQARIVASLKDVHAEEALVAGFGRIGSGDPHWAEALRDEAARLAAKREGLEGELARAAQRRALLGRAEKEPGLLRALLPEGGPAKEERSLSALDEAGWKSGQTRTAKGRVGDVPLEQVTSEEVKVDLAAGSRSRTTTEQLTSGARSWSRSTEQTVDLGKGEVRREETEVRRTTIGDPKDPEGVSIETSETQRRGTTVGLGGISQTESTRSVDADRQMKERSSKREVIRGGGGVGVRRTSSRTEGKVNEEGELEEGVSRSTSVEAKALAGPEGVGASFGATGKVESVPSEGVKTGVTVSPSGQFLVSVEEVPDSEPKSYRLVLALKVGLALGASRGVEGALRDAGKGKAATLEAEGGARLGGSWGLVFRHVLNAAEVTEYFRDLELAEGGDLKNGSWPELAIVKAARRSDMDSMTAVRQMLKARWGDWAAALEDLREGDSIEINRSLTAGLEFTGGAKATGGASASIGAGVGRTQELKYVLSRAKGKARIQVERADEVERSGSASAGYLAGSFGVERSSKASVGGGFTFALDPADGAYLARLKEIMDAEDLDTLRRLAERRPEDIVERSRTEGTSESGKETLGLGPLALGFRHGASRQQSTTIEEGKVVKRFEGANTVGVTPSALGLSYSSDVEESVKAKVGEEGALADVRKTQSHTDVGASADRLVTLLAKDPIGLLTGGAQVMQTTRHLAGMEFTAEDLTAIAEAAADPEVWARGVLVSGKHVDDWSSTRKRILEGGATVESVAAALSWFVGKEFQGRAEAVHRLATKLGIGNRYEWPAGTAQNQKTFVELVVLDPTEGPMKLAGRGDFEKAAEQLRERQARLRLLGASLEIELARFLDPRALAEMIRKTAERKLQVQDAVRRLEAVMRPADGPDDAARQAQDAQEAQRDQMKAALTTARSSKALEQKVLGELAAVRGRIVGGTAVAAFLARLRSVQALRPRWDAALRELERLPGAPNGPALDQYRPDERAWQAQSARVPWM